MKKQKTLGKLKKDAQDVFNKYIRMRDSENGYFKCISCGIVKKVDQMNAGHFHAVGSCDVLRFDERNVNGECIACNMHNDMHLFGYAENLIFKIGKVQFDYLQLIREQYKRGQVNKLTRADVLEVIEKYKSKIKEL